MEAPLLKNKNQVPEEDQDELILVQEEEVEKLKQCLPKTIFLGITLINYQGFWCPEHALKNVLTFQNHFKARDSDLIICSFPKTGNTWLKALVFSIVNRKKIQTQNHNLLTKNPHELVYFLEGEIYGKAFEYPQPQHLHELPSPRLLHTHLPYHSLPESIRVSGCRILYLSRNPLDTFISMFHFAAKVMKNMIGEDQIHAPTMEEYFEDCYQGRILYGPFFDHVIEYWKRQDSKKIIFLLYEDFMDNTVAQIKRIADFVGFPFSTQEENEGVIQEIVELCGFKNLKELEANKNGVINKFFYKKDYFRKGQVGDWTNYFTPSMMDRLNKLMEQKLGGTRLSFKFQSS